MAGQIPDLIAKVRTGTGKGAARQARREGNVPGIVYGDGKEPMPISIRTMGGFSTSRMETSTKRVVSYGIE